MAKKSKRGNSVEEPQIVNGFVDRNVEEVQASGASRITINVNEEGSIDWEKAKPGAADELLTAITNDPTMLEKIAACPELQDDEDVLPKVTNEEAGMVLDLITAAEGVVFSGISKKILGMKISSSVVNENFKLSESDHARQDPLAAQGLTMLQEYLQLDPKWRWLAFLGVAHAAALGRNVKNCIVAQYSKDENDPPNPALQGIEERKPN